MDKTLNSIKGVINDFDKLLQELLPPLEAEINQLITDKVQESSAIEHYLDTLLSLANHGIAEDLFISLLEYYKKIDVEGAAFYWNEFDNNGAE